MTRSALDATRILQAALGLGVAALLIADAVAGLRTALRRLARLLEGRWSDIEHRAAREARRAEIAQLAALATRIRRGRG